MIYLMGIGDSARDTVASERKANREIPPLPGGVDNGCASRRIEPEGVMRAFRWRSINVLVVVGYAVVGLPLVLAILLSTVYFDRLARLGEAAVTTGVEATRQGRILSEQLTAMERHARQYAVLQDETLLDLFERRQSRFEAAAEELRQTLADAEIAASIEHLLRQSRAVVLLPETGLETEADVFEDLLEITIDINNRIRTLTENRTAELQVESRRIQQRLVWQAASVIALAMLMAMIFTLMISRAVRQLAKAISRLGEGRFEHKVTVSGPEDLERLGGQLDWLRRRLLSTEEDKNAFLRHVSHELKTPLANIREGSELMVDGTLGKLSEAQHEVADIMRDNSLLLQDQIENLLNFNAWQNLRGPLHREPVRLDQLIERVLDRHRLAIRQRQLNVLAELQPVTLSGDGRKIEIMLDNLVSNAVKYSPGGGRLLIRIEPRGRQVRLLVGDDGPGIEPAERKRVFRAFYQGRQQAIRSHVQGTGVGLSVVLECVRAHEGKVQIIDGETNGAMFEVILPVG